MVGNTGDALAPEELLRYSRQIRLPGFGVEAQERLRRSRVLVIGLGGLGSPAAFYLAAAGVGRLGLAEFDTVALHNLQRQILHGTAAVGQSKLGSAMATLRALNPHVELVPHPEGVTEANAVELFSRYDLVLDGADNFATRYLVNDAAYAARIPVVSGSVFQFEGQVTVWHPHGGGPCYRCLFPRAPGPGEVPNCDEAGVLGALCGVIGSLQAMEAAKLLAGIGESLAGRLLVFDSLDAVPRVLRLKRDPACPLCGEHPAFHGPVPGSYGASCGAPGTAAAIPDSISPTMAKSPALPDPENLPEEIDLATARAWLASSAKPLLLDVREGFEREIVSLPGSVHVPMREVPAAVAELDPGQPILVQCHHGGRSLQVTKYLRARGLRATNMKGGIDAWAATYDPKMPRY